MNVFDFLNCALEPMYQKVSVWDSESGMTVYIGVAHDAMYSEYSNSEVKSFNTESDGTLVINI